MTDMTYEQITGRLVSLARANGGVVTADQAEHDPQLALEDPAIVSAAARALDGATNVFGTPRSEGVQGWFPFEELRFTALANTAAVRRIAKKASPRGN
jgi:hypothetical protein